MKKLSKALEKIKENIEKEEYEKADWLLKEELKLQKEYDDVIAILEGSIAEAVKG